MSGVNISEEMIDKIADQACRESSPGSAIFFQASPLACAKRAVRLGFEAAISAQTSDVAYSATTGFAAMDDLADAIAAVRDEYEFARLKALDRMESALEEEISVGSGDRTNSSIYSSEAARKGEGAVAVSRVLRLVEVSASQQRSFRLDKSTHCTVPLYRGKEG